MNRVSPAFMKYPELLRDSLEKYINKVAKHCQELPDYAEGMTYIVLCGLGRGFRLGFKDWPTDGDCQLSAYPTSLCWPEN